MAAGPRSSIVRYPLVSCSHCWMTCRLHLTMSLTSRQDFARYKHPVWKRMHGISGKQLCGCRDTAQRARSRCQFLAARPHGVLHWHHHISTARVDLSSSPEFRENVYESCSAIQCVLVFCSVNNCLLRRIKQKDLQGCDQGVHESVQRDSDKRLDTRIKNADARMHHSKALPTD